MSTEPAPHGSEDVAARIERKWALLMVSIMVVLVAMVIFTGLHWARMPPSRVETIQPKTLDVSREFIESNLGSEVEPDGSVMVRILAQHHSFAPHAVSADVVHDLLITNTNINATIAPGHISTPETTFTRAVDHLMPCHEFCGMWAHGDGDRQARFPSDSEFQQLAKTQSS